ncbi:MAG: glycine cleavage system protein GcvH [Myxococcota bacterium]
MKYFTKEHEWVSIDGNTATVGITHHAQKALGDVVYLELPQPGKQITQAKVFGVVESVKAVSDLFAPISGEVLETHEDLIQNPEWINEDPEKKGWMIKISFKNSEEINKLLSEADYQKYLDEEVK